MSSDSAFECPRCRAPVTADTTQCARCGEYLGERNVHPEAWLGRTIGGKYSLEGVLGIGGMGMVFRARRVLVGDEVALKVLYPRFLQSPLQRRLFRDEAVAAARLSHPNVVTVFDADLGGDDVAYIAMELLNGEPLKKLLRDRAPLPPAEAVPIFVEVCEGLAAAHEARVIHRDLKPDNVFLEQRPGGGYRVKLVDFGIAAMLDVDGHDEQRRLMGTLRYMAPEQCRGEALGPAADLYALGVVMYETLTRRRATGRTVSAILNDEVVPPNLLLGPEKALPRSLEALVMRLLAKTPAERPASAIEVREALLASVERKSAPPRASVPPPRAPTPAPPPAPPPKPAARRSAPARAELWFGLVMAVVIGLVGGVIWALVDR
jgi:serine/threonine-protein kinase